jgi:HB1, ASXL, restriction endonuclease HTH domain
MSGTVNNDLTTIRIGTRVRHVADNATGRIVWANAAVVKIQWDDGEKVTWKRAELSAKGLEMLGEEESPRPSEPEATSADPPAAESVVLAAAGAEAIAAPEATEAPREAPSMSPPDAATEPVPPAPDGGADRATGKQAKRNRPPEVEAGKLSALDAAAKVLQEAGRPMSCQEMITAMADKGYWSSPGGKTPAATLYSAILRELQTKPGTSRFVKTERGKFGRTSAV